MFRMENEEDDLEMEHMDLASKEKEIIEFYEEEAEEDDDDYEDFREVGILEENRKIKLIKNIFYSLLIIFFSMIIIDITAVIILDKGPFFAIPTITYKDGGTKEYYGLGYKVIKYHQIQGRRDREIGLWNLTYHTNAITLKDSSLAEEFKNKPLKTYQKYYKKFVRISSTLQEIDVAKHQITLKYVDDNTSLDIICSMAKDQEDLSIFMKQKPITIIGTIKSFKRKNSAVYISNCFAEQ